MSEKTRNECLAMLDKAAVEGGFLAVPRGPLRRRLSRMVRAGAVVSPACGIFAREGYWSGLKPLERHARLVRALAKLHPAWVFCDVSAAVIHGLPVSYPLLSRVHVAVSQKAHSRSTPHIARHTMCKCSVEEVDGVKVTPFGRTVFDCLRAMGFRDGLAIADAALRMRGSTSEELVEAIKRRKSHCRGVERALMTALHADGRAESGGESIARAALIELGYALPELQVEVESKLGAYRADFQWKLPDGRIVLGELDGHEKYQNPDMTGGRSAVDVLADERIRESHLSAAGYQVMRFSYADVCSDWRLRRILDAFGIPRVPVGDARPEEWRMVLDLGAWHVIATSEVWAA